jgi:tetratricopeptide (TPR) repeat protein
MTGALVTGMTIAAGFPNLRMWARLVVTGVTMIGTAIFVSASETRRRSGMVNPSVAPVVPLPRQLPPEAPHFVGRQDVLDDVASDLDRSGRAPVVVAFSGQGGVGKSALAAHLAHKMAADFPDGQLYVDLRGTDPDPVGPTETLRSLLFALGANMATDIDDLDDLISLWRSWLADRRVLVFLDNAADESQVDPLMPPSAGSIAVVTSRRPLPLLPGWRYRLNPLDADDAVTLLSRLVGEERVGAEQKTAAEIVRLCDRLPLAISLAAARLTARPYWRLTYYVDKLRDETGRLSELEDGKVGVRATMALSYAGLSTTEQRLFRLLGTLGTPDFPGWAAAALLDVSLDSGEEVLEQLVEAQLVECVGEATTGVLRYRLHDLVRVYAKEQLGHDEPQPARITAQHRLLSGYLDLAEACAADQWPQEWSRAVPYDVRRWRPMDPRWGAVATRSPLSWCRVERAALIAAVSQANAAREWLLCWGLCHALGVMFNNMRAYWGDWLFVAGAGLSAAEAAGFRAGAGVCMLDLARVHNDQGNLNEALTLARQGLEIFQELKDRRWTADAQRLVGMTLRDMGRLEEGAGHLRSALEAFDAAGDRWWRARVQRNLAELLREQERHAEAVVLLTESLATSRTDGDALSAARTLRALGEVRGRQGQVQDAFALLEEAVSTFRSLHARWDEARTFRSLGEICRQLPFRRRLDLLRGALETMRDLGDQWGEARTQLGLGSVLTERRRSRHEAVERLRCAASVFRNLEDAWWEARALLRLGKVLAQIEEVQEAAEVLERSQSAFQQIGDNARHNLARSALGSIH